MASDGLDTLARMRYKEKLVPYMTIIITLLKCKL